MALKRIEYTVDAVTARAASMAEPEGIVRFAALAALLHAESEDPQFTNGLLRAKKVSITIEFEDPQEELPL